MHKDLDFLKAGHISGLSSGTQYFIISHLINPGGQSQSICDLVHVSVPLTLHLNGFSKGQPFGGTIQS
jgi:hypothetical protein